MEGKTHKIHVKGGPPECPLCRNTMREVIQKNKQPLVFTRGWTPVSIFYVCVREGCMVSIRKNDPCIKQWDKINNPSTAPKCQFCQKPMRVFVRSDRFCIMQCRDKSHYPYQVARGNAESLPPLKGDKDANPEK